MESTFYLWHRNSLCAMNTLNIKQHTKTDSEEPDQTMPISRIRVLAVYQ